MERSGEKGVFTFNTPPIVISMLFYLDSTLRCFSFRECYGLDMEYKKGRHKKIKRRTLYVQVDGLDLSVSEVIEVAFAPHQKEKTDLPD